MPDLPEEHLAARKDAIAKMEEIVSKLRDVNDHDAAGVVQHAVEALKLPLVLPARDKHGEFPTIVV